MMYGLIHAMGAKELAEIHAKTPDQLRLSDDDSMRSLQAGQVLDFVDRDHMQGDSS